MELNNLRPCPFCGMDDVTINRTEYESAIVVDAYYEILCGRCDIEGPIGFTQEEAVDRWNRRDKMAKKSPPFDYFDYEPILEHHKAKVEYSDEFFSDGEIIKMPEYGSYNLTWENGVMHLDYGVNDREKARMCAALFIYMFTRGISCDIAISCARLYTNNVNIERI